MVQQMGTKILRQLGLFCQVKGWLRDNLTAINYYWRGSYKNDGAKVMGLNLFLPFQDSWRKPDLGQTPICEVY